MAYWYIVKLLEVYKQLIWLILCSALSTTKQPQSTKISQNLLTELNSSVARWLQTKICSTRIHFLQLLDPFVAFILGKQKQLHNCVSLPSHQLTKCVQCSNSHSWRSSLNKKQCHTHRCTWCNFFSLFYFKTMMEQHPSLSIWNYGHSILPATTLCGSSFPQGFPVFTHLTKVAFMQHAPHMFPEPSTYNSSQIYRKDRAASTSRNHALITYENLKHELSTAAHNMRQFPPIWGYSLLSLLYHSRVQWNGNHARPGSAFYNAKWSSVFGPREFPMPKHTAVGIVLTLRSK